MNGTGPQGQGSRTGRGMGKCGEKSTDNNNQSNDRPGLGRKNCPNKGLGLGRRCRNQASS